jgi:hypothetical protein
MDVEESSGKLISGHYNDILFEGLKKVMKSFSLGSSVSGVGFWPTNSKIQNCTT